ncbi:MAG: radical SAM protein [Acidimicrobiia bacterium]|nr:radical SAM protein [Acidimicrobiia bacterium]MDH3397463.1 radical SAM protein [Acidimicrobiia bacterium]
MRSGPTGKVSPVLTEHEPAYLTVQRSGGLDATVSRAMTELQNCRACPRDCGVDRSGQDPTLCRIGRYVRVAAAFPHFGEEDCLRGTRGSGTIFFSSCNLRCVFCQNWDISSAPTGRELDAFGLADLMLALQEAGCHNINLVTPEHVAPHIVEALAVAIPDGLRIPLVYNTSAYDGLTSLRLMDGLVDIFMPDFKFWAPETSRRLARAREYPQVARAAIAEMHRQVGDLQLGPDGVARRGLLVRHLVMPGQGEETAAILQWLAEEISPNTYVNIMDQYRPDHRVSGHPRYVDIDRRVSRDEVDAAFVAARRAGLWRLDRRP